MSDKLLTVITLSYSILIQSGLYAAVPAKIGTTATATTEVATSSDLRPTLARMRTQNKLVQGKNLILTSNAQGGIPSFKLWATVDQGNVTKWQAVDASGKNLPTNTNTVAQADGSIECRICVRLPGEDIAVCYDIDCKDAPKPKPKEATRR